MVAAERHKLTAYDAAYLELTSALATSTGQCAGTTICSPAEALFNSDSVHTVVSSSKHQGSTADASATKPDVNTFALLG